MDDLRIELEPSRWAFGGYVVSAVAGTAGIWRAGLPEAARLVLSGVVLALVVRALRLVALRRGPGSVRVVGRREGGEWWVSTGAGEYRVVTLTGRALVHPWLVVSGLGGLSGSSRGRMPAPALVVPIDACSPEHHRRLRVVLRRDLVALAGNDHGKRRP